MSKGRYVNFARKKQFKGRKIHHRKAEDEQSANSKQNIDGNLQVCVKTIQRKAKPTHSTFKFSTKEEDAEINRLLQSYQNVSLKADEVANFNSFPLSKKSLAGLEEASYIKPTVIQRESILPALRGEDILAAAKTGSGKTLAFLIPILECLYINKWSRLDGLGALIITPTRELALQIFEAIAQIGKHHDVTTGLIIGGQNLKFEKTRLHNLNIIIGTPGRLLQHMDQNPLFDATNLKVLVLDEADRCLDMGFASAMNAIIENLPLERQTLLFSATQTKAVYEWARVKQKNPHFIAPHEHEASATPVKLQQSYVVVDLHEKLTMLWSFLRTHSKQKIIAFFATCKQVKYFYQILKKLRPANLLLPLYGGMNQEKRNAIYAEFCDKNSNVCLMATDVASRGLDFPRVNWVVQMDCPEDATQYIHRAGRTARLNTSGENLLVLLPHEVPAMLASLTDSKIHIKQIKIDERQLFSPLVKIQSLLAQSPELKECAKRAFVAYIKSVALMKNRDIFQLEKLNLDKYANSLGLNVTPRVRFLTRVPAKAKQAAARNLATSKSLDEHITTGDSAEEYSDDNDFLQVKRVVHDSNPSVACVSEKDVSTLQLTKLENVSKKRISKAKMIKKSFLVSKRTMFNDDGLPMIENGTDSISQRYDINEARLKLQQQDAIDKERHKQLKKAKRNAHKEKERKRKINNEHDVNEDFASDSDETVNLDWLPDPDKFYGNEKKIDNASSRGVSDDEEIEDKHHFNVQKKRMLLQQTHELTLKEAEQLAMNLLQ